VEDSHTGAFLRGLVTPSKRRARRPPRQPVAA
jgi:hypothetical protein